MPVAIFFTPVTLSVDGKKHVSATEGSLLSPVFVPVSTDGVNLLKNLADGLSVKADDFVSATDNNIIKLGVDGKLFALPAEPKISADADNMLGFGSDGGVKIDGNDILSNAVINLLTISEVDGKIKLTREDVFEVLEVISKDDGNLLERGEDGGAYADFDSLVNRNDKILYEGNNGKISSEVGVEYDANTGKLNITGHDGVVVDTVTIMTSTSSLRAVYIVDGKPDASGEEDTVGDYMLSIAMKYGDYDFDGGMGLKFHTKLNVEQTIDFEYELDAEHSGLWPEVARASFLEDNRESAVVSTQPTNFRFADGSLLTINWKALTGMKLTGSATFTPGVGIIPGKYMRFVYLLSNGSVVDVYVNVDDFIDNYTGGCGIKVANDVISVLLRGDGTTGKPYNGLACHNGYLDLPLIAKSGLMFGAAQTISGASVSPIMVHLSEDGTLKLGEDGGIAVDTSKIVGTGGDDNDLYVDESGQLRVDPYTSGCGIEMDGKQIIVRLHEDGGILCNVANGLSIDEDWLAKRSDKVQAGCGIALTGDDEFVKTIAVKMDLTAANDNTSGLECLAAGASSEGSQGGLAVKLNPLGGLRKDADGVATKTKAGGGIRTDADGVYVDEEWLGEHAPKPVAGDGINVSLSGSDATVSVKVDPEGGLPVGENGVGVDTEWLTPQLGDKVDAGLGITVTEGEDAKSIAVKPKDAGGILIDASGVYIDEKWIEEHCLGGDYVAGNGIIFNGFKISVRVGADGHLDFTEAGELVADMSTMVATKDEENALTFDSEGKFTVNVVSSDEGNLINVGSDKGAYLSADDLPKVMEYKPGDGISFSAETDTTTTINAKVKLDAGLLVDSYGLHIDTDWLAQHDKGDIVSAGSGVTIVDQGTTKNISVKPGADGGLIVNEDGVFIDEEWLKDHAGGDTVVAGNGVSITANGTNKTVAAKAKAEGGIVVDADGISVDTEWLSEHAASNYKAGNGIAIASDTISAKAGDGIEVAAAGIAVDDTVVRTSGDQTIADLKAFTGKLNQDGTITQHIAVVSSALDKETGRANLVTTYGVDDGKLLSSISHNVSPTDHTILMNIVQEAADNQVASLGVVIPIFTELRDVPSPYGVAPMTPQNPINEAIITYSFFKKHVRDYEAGDGLELALSTFQVKAKTDGGIVVDETGVSVDTTWLAEHTTAGDKVAAGNGVTVTGTDTKTITVKVKADSGLVVDASGVYVDESWLDGKVGDKVTAGNGITLTGTGTKTVAAKAKPDGGILVDSTGISVSADWLAENVDTGDKVAAGNGVSISGTTTKTITAKAKADGGITVDASGISVNTTWLAKNVDTGDKVAAGNGVTISGTGTKSVAVKAKANGGIKVEAAGVSVNADWLETQVTNAVDAADYADMPLYYTFESSATIPIIHTFIPGGRSTVQLIAKEADGAGANALTFSIAPEFSSGSAVTIGTSATDISALDGKAVKISVSGNTNQTAAAALIRFK
jgi:hypothetical protein